MADDRFSSIMDKVKSVKNADQDQLLLDSSKGTLTSTIIGAGVGILVAYNRKNNLVMGAIIGATLAGLAANFFINKDEK